MIVHILPGFYNNINEIDFIRSNIFPRGYLGKNYLYFTNNSNCFNNYAFLESNYNLEKIFSTENIDLFNLNKFPKYEFNYLNTINNVNNALEILKNKTPKYININQLKIAYNSFLVVKEFIEFCNENSCNTIYWIIGNIIRKKYNKIKSNLNN